MARRDTFLSIGSFDEGFRRCAEWDYAIRAAFLGAHFIAVDRCLVPQHKTTGYEKAGLIPLEYALRLREKYRAYLKSHQFYRASRAMARAQFYGGANRMWMSRTYALMACLVSPSFFWGKIVGRVEGFGILRWLKAKKPGVNGPEAG
jgi:hypothetical protein